MYHYGDRFQLGGVRVMLAQVGNNLATLIALDDGNRWMTPRSVAGHGATHDELLLMAGSMASSMRQIHKAAEPRPVEQKTPWDDILAEFNIDSTNRLADILGAVGDFIEAYDKDDNAEYAFDILASMWEN